MATERQVLNCSVFEAPRTLTGEVTDDKQFIGFYVHSDDTDVTFDPDSRLADGIDTVCSYVGLQAGFYPFVGRNMTVSTVDAKVTLSLKIDA
jgi:hypothetical protein